MSTQIASRSVNDNNLMKQQLSSLLMNCNQNINTNCNYMNLINQYCAIDKSSKQSQTIDTNENNKNNENNEDNIDNNDNNDNINLRLEEDEGETTSSSSHIQPPTVIRMESDDSVDCFSPNTTNLLLTAPEWNPSPCAQYTQSTQSNQSDQSNQYTLQSTANTININNDTQNLHNDNNINGKDKKDNKLRHDAPEFCPKFGFPISSISTISTISAIPTISTIPTTSILTLSHTSSLSLSSSHSSTNTLPTIQEIEGDENDDAF